jgi:hypothetical protein
MLKQVVQDEELVHRRLVKDRSMPRRFVQDEALQRNSQKSVRDNPQMSKQVVQESRTKILGTSTLFKIDTHYPGDSSETKRSEQPQLIFRGRFPNVHASRPGREPWARALCSNEVMEHLKC